MKEFLPLLFVDPFIVALAVAVFALQGSLMLSESSQPAAIIHVQDEPPLETWRE